METPINDWIKGIFCRKISLLLILTLSLALRFGLKSVCISLATPVKECFAALTLNIKVPFFQASTTRSNLHGQSANICKEYKMCIWLSSLLFNMLIYQRRIHIVWKLLTMSQLNFWILAFSANFCPLKIDLLFKNSSKLTIFGIFNELLSTQNVNAASSS